ncbi:hypothetical protein COX00_04120 [Candidatus Uhrbacteria bacterium CG22_combo_CG10-13_8_21_14_all_47_17]|uniref:Uncharacterized protein n=1 Tax=Candidatus Uhrbacteria bacterium CG22_combo_CG10-13_8_21_14_all_47_17 TaxID=1975041 RepID=A0A2H0BRA7_9BACT|nr:MAG: hypothetical protein COX00_04120 [Candidatus Uhrbacteria bacterium CG22_combo_CG10-13_8_21_14_all_47_17]
MKGYYKLPTINYRIATHEGTASRRLASQANELLPMPIESVPDECKKDFTNLKRLIEETLNNLPRNSGLMVPVRLANIHNSTAVKYIKLLMEIEYKTTGN